MLYNCSFDTYRRELSGSTRQYSSSKTITSGDGFIEPAGGDLKAVLGLDNVSLAYQLLTNETDFEIRDKVTISGSNYYVEQFETQTYGGNKLSRLILLKKD